MTFLKGVLASVTLVILLLSSSLMLMFSTVYERKPKPQEQWWIPWQHEPLEEETFGSWLYDGWLTLYDCTLVVWCRNRIYSTYQALPSCAESLDYVSEMCTFISGSLVYAISCVTHCLNHCLHTTTERMLVIALCISVLVICYFGFHRHLQRAKNRNRYKTRNSKTSSHVQTSLPPSHSDQIECRKCQPHFLIQPSSFVKLVLCLLLLSLPWEFVRLYQHQVAQQAAISLKGVPAECVPSKMSYLSTVRAWLAWQFSWDSDQCEVYHKSLLVDPVWEVTPLMVVSSAFTRCITAPLEILCSSLGRCCRHFFSEIPSPWQPIILFVGVAMLLVLSMMWCRYRLTLPLLFRLEPVKQSDAQSNKCHNSIRRQRELPYNDSKYVCDGRGDVWTPTKTRQNGSRKHNSTKDSIEWSDTTNTSIDSDCYIVS